MQKSFVSRGGEEQKESRTSLYIYVLTNPPPEALLIFNMDAGVLPWSVFHRHGLQMVLESSGE